MLKTHLHVSEYTCQWCVSVRACVVHVREYVCLRVLSKTQCIKPASVVAIFGNCNVHAVAIDRRALVLYVPQEYLERPNNGRKTEGTVL